MEMIESEWEINMHNAFRCWQIDANQKRELLFSQLEEGLDAENYVPKYSY